MRRKGFTLIELLVVIAIIALLLTVVLPSLGKAKYIAKDIVCRSNIRQWALASNVYSNDNEGKLPSIDMPPCGMNLWDVASKFVTFSGEYKLTTMANPEPCVMTTYGITEPEFKYCPLATTDTKDNIGRYMDWWSTNGWPNFTLFIGYSWWVPRVSGKTTTNPGVEFPIDPVTPLKMIAPKKTSDKGISTKPIITDVVLTTTSTSPNYLINPAGLPLAIETGINMALILNGLLPSNTVYITHNRNGEVQKINLGYGDIHVDIQRPDEIRRRHTATYANFY